ncbi:MAG TPA: hypothetical protein VMF90_18540 [Rhizobiaceae bacterium]|nr:hypothetical protein [Rhizobiaceae bacterium]
MNTSASIPFRIGVFLIGYLIAAAVAALAYTSLIAISAQIIGVEAPSDMTGPEQTRMFFGFAVIVGVFVLTTSFLPAVAAVLLLWLVGLRDIVSHMVAGAAVSAAAVLITARYIPFMDELTLNWAIALSGAIGGGAFWAVQRKLLPRSSTSPAP